MKKLFVWIILIATILSELAFIYNQTLGFLIYSLLITGILIYLYEIDSLNEKGKLLIFFTIFPLVRLAGLFIPFSLFWRTLIIYSLMLFLCIYYYKRLNLSQVFKKGKMKFLPVGILLGVILGVLGNQLPFPRHPEVLFILPLVAFTEEFLLKGLIQKTLRQSEHKFISVLIPSLFYGVFSISLGILPALFLSMQAFISSWMYEYSDNITIPMSMNLIVGVLIYTTSIFSFI